MSARPQTGARCTCKRGQERDNCPQCEGTGWVIDFAAIRAQIRTLPVLRRSHVGPVQDEGGKP